MKTLLALILIILLSAGAYWYLTNDKQKGQVRDVESQAAERARQMGDAVKDKFKDFSLSVPEIKQELERTGRVVRKKANLRLSQCRPNHMVSCLLVPVTSS